MPTMKDIANALREAGDAAYDPENELLDRAWLDKYELLSTQVEQMRCETCQSGDIEGSYIMLHE